MLSIQVEFVDLAASVWWASGPFVFSRRLDLCLYLVPSYKVFDPVRSKEASKSHSKEREGNVRRRKVR